MSPKEQKEFIDALEDRVYVLVTIYHNDEIYISSHRYTPKEMVDFLKEHYSWYHDIRMAKCVYVAHYKDTKQPVHKAGFI